MSDIQVISMRDGYFRVTKVVKGDRWTRVVAPTDSLTAAEIAAALSVSVMTVNRWMEDGTLKSFQWAHGGRRVAARTVRQYALANGLFLGASK